MDGDNMDNKEQKTNICDFRIHVLSCNHYAEGGCIGFERSPNQIEDYTGEQTTRSLNPIQPVWYMKASEENDALAKAVKDTLKQSTITFERDSDIMESADRIEITFKSGETISYGKGEWDDYAYDGKAVIVKQKGAWIGIYNFDHVFCVELKEN